MDDKTLANILRKADPQNNPSDAERQTALEIARREMKKGGHSYASLGFDFDEAQRIENQFSLSTPKKEKPQKSAPLVRSQNAGISMRRAERETYSQHEPRQSYAPPSETYVEQCEREDRRAFDRKYEELKSEWVANSTKTAEMERFAAKLNIVLIIFFLALTFGIVYWVVSVINAG